MAIYPYQTEPLTDFSKQENIDAYEKGLQEVERYLGQSYDLIIDGKRVKTDEQMHRVNPANKNEMIGTISQATLKEADLAIEVALKRFDFWKDVDAKVRADVLFKAAAF
jgi:1-pyrroline-5-carboxylate dehydrogenase